MLSKASIRSHPIHPMLVAFPIGLWVTSFIFDLIGAASHEQQYFATGFYLAIAGIVGAVFAALPGLIDLLYTVPPNSSAKNRGFIHGGLNTLVLILFIAEVVYRKGPTNPADGLSLLISLIGVIGLGFSGWLGGTLVYRNQIGVDRRYAGAGKQKQRTLDSFDRPVCNTGELAECQMMLANIDGQRIAVGKCSEGMFAFVDRCSHRGGSLSDGALVGCTVQCPWHGSQFDIRTGRVVAGPAEQKVRIYEVEIRGGEVYVKPEVPGEVRKAA
jgi:uncharacterized membrane protein/nitrite reductase/ring-hydroxylating ferredoxin subunit